MTYREILSRLHCTTLENCSTVFSYLLKSYYSISVMFTLNKIKNNTF